MITIKFDTTNSDYVYINGELYIKAERQNKEDIFSIFNFDAPISEWVKLSASEIYKLINNKAPKSKSEITQFSIKFLSNDFIKKGRSASGRYYVMPPLFDI
jgi:hypothetical protein